MLMTIQTASEADRPAVVRCQDGTEATEEGSRGTRAPREMQPIIAKTMTPVTAPRSGGDATGGGAHEDVSAADVSPSVPSHLSGLGDVFVAEFAFEHLADVAAGKRPQHPHVGQALHLAEPFVGPGA